MATPPIQPRILKGFRDYLPADMIPRSRMLDTVRRVFEEFGFAPLETPALEYRDILLGKYGEEGDKLLYTFTDHGGRDVAMRYDLTVPLARVVAQYPQLEKPFRRYQIGPVWRAEKPGRGRFREFTQCDVDIVGSPSMMADAECVTLAGAVLAALGVRRFVVRANNRKLLNGLLARHGVTSTERCNATLRVVDKIEKIGREAVVSTLVEAEGWERGAAEDLLGILDAGADLDALAAWPETSQGADELRRVLDLAAAAGIPPGGEVRADLTIARGLDYYTGTVYEAGLPELPGFGSVMGGGRYDELLRQFTGTPLPAVGISLGVDRLLAGLGELGLTAPARTPTRVLVAVFGAGQARAAVATGALLRQAGIPTEVYPGEARLDRQFKYADRKGIPVVALVGPEEEAAGTVRIKVLATGHQETVDRAALVGRISSLV